MKNLLYLVTLSVSIFAFETAYSQIILDAESGVVFTGYNDIRIPNNTGTTFSLKDDLKSQTTFFYRLRGTYIFKNKHTFSLLYAPLQIHSNGITKQDIGFQGVLYPADSYLEGTYKFNSYRFTYRYNLIHTTNFVVGLGLTGKIRDAKVELTSSTLTSQKANVGFVPIVNFSFLWKMNNKFGVLFEGDALYSSQGRAEDIQLAATYQHSNKIGMRVGYRILEGGSSGGSVYGFALFHYASVGLHFNFDKQTKNGN